MRVALLFPQDPRGRPPGIDLVRLGALAGGLRSRGVAAEIVAPVARAGRFFGVPLRPLAALGAAPGYDLVKACYHQAVFLAGDYRGPLVARLVRVVDGRHPARDRGRRAELRAAQEAIRRRAQAVAFNNPENLDRWQRLYGSSPPGVLAPTGCPERLPPRGPDPFGGHPAVVYAGSLASPRQVDQLNRLAAALAGRARIHLVGRNKSGLYGRLRRLSPLVADHGEKPSRAVWDYLRWGRGRRPWRWVPSPRQRQLQSVALPPGRAAGGLRGAHPPGLPGGRPRLGRVAPYADPAGLGPALGELWPTRPPRPGAGGRGDHGPRPPLGPHGDGLPGALRPPDGQIGGRPPCA